MSVFLFYFTVNSNTVTNATTSEIIEQAITPSSNRIVVAWKVTPSSNRSTETLEQAEGEASLKQSSVL